MKYIQKGVNGRTYDISCIAWIWCEGREMRHRLRSAEGHETETLWWT